MLRVEERFWAKVNQSDGCWLWLACLTKNGYGKFGWRYKTMLAHRMAWILTYGEEPLGDLDHLCWNRRCVNPSHLRIATRRENLANLSPEAELARGQHNRNKTECPQGHTYTKDSTYIYIT